MAEGIRFVSVKRGIDPRRFSLVPLGGGGPVHATALARELGMRRVIVPLHPGVLSAAGLLAAPVEHEAALAFNAPVAEVSKAALAESYAGLDARCASLMALERVPRASVERHYLADVCYIGQSYHLEVPVDMTGDTLEKLTRDFYAAHDRIYGHSAQGPIKLVNLRAVHQAQTDGTHAALRYEASPGVALKGVRRILTAESGGFVEAQVYERSRMRPGTRLEGPAIVEQGDTTTVLEPGWRGAVDERGSLILSAPDRA
jgi:N-methylhydantoinase A